MGRHTQTAPEAPGGPDPPEEPEQFWLFNVLTPKNTTPDKHLSDIIKVFFCSDVTKGVCPYKIYIVTSSPFCPGSERPFSPWKTNALSPAMIYHLSAPWWLAAKQYLTVSAQKHSQAWFLRGFGEISLCYKKEAGHKSWPPAITTSE